MNLFGDNRMSIFIFTAVIVLIFFPLIYFMWSSFVSMLFWQWKFRRMSDEDKEKMMTGGLVQESLRPEPKTRKGPVKTGLYNFVTADEFIAALRRPDLPPQRLRRVLEELAGSRGLIRADQQAELRRLVALVRTRLAWNEGEMKALIKKALMQLDEATLIDQGE